MLVHIHVVAAALCLVGRVHGLLELLFRKELVALCLERVSHVVMCGIKVL
jgi:hypothetical protein